MHIKLLATLEIEISISDETQQIEHSPQDERDIMFSVESVPAAQAVAF